VVVAKAVEHPDVHFIPFSHEEMVIIVSPEHNLAKKKALSFKELASEPFIMKENGSGTRKVVENLFAREQCSPDILMETSNTEFIKELVQRGEGVSFLVQEAVRAEVQEGTLAAIPVKGKKVFLDVSIAYLKGQVLSPAARAFVNTLVKLKTEEMDPLGIGAMMARMRPQRE